MVSTLVSRSNSPGSSPGPRPEQERHLTLTVPLSTQVYKWVQVNLMLGVAQDKLQPGGPLGPYVDLTLYSTLQKFSSNVFNMAVMRCGNRVCSRGIIKLSNPKLKSHLRMFVLIVSAHPYCARQFTPRHG